MTNRVLAAAALLALFAACGGDDEPAAAPTPQPAVTAAPATTEPPPSEAPPVSAAPASQPPEEGVGPTAGKATPEEAAQAFYEDWAELDRRSAAEYATEAAIDEAFGMTRAQADFTGCTEEMDHFVCFYYYEGGGLGITVVDSDAYGYIVTDIHYVAD